MLKIIGNTPLVKISNIFPTNCAQIWIKMESFNPTGSYKDRVALAMINGAKKDARIMARHLATQEGIVATVTHDTGFKYLNESLYK